MAFLIFSIAVGIAALGTALFWNATGWHRLSQFLYFLVGWLPATSVLSLIVLITLGVKAGWRWTLIAGIIVLLAAAQWILLMMYGDHRPPYCMLPTVLLVLSSVAIYTRNDSAALAAPAWLQRASPFLLPLAPLLLATAYGLKARGTAERNAQAEAYRIAYEKNQATARGLERAAWLLGMEFGSQDGYQESDFLREGRFKARKTGTEYRWDDRTHCLHIVRPLVFRDRVLRVPDAAMKSKALQPGTRTELGNGLLRCEAPPKCTLSWMVNVDNLSGSTKLLRAVTEAWASALAESVDKELFPGK